MGADDWPDWLPGDWTVNISKINGQKVKCYAHPEGHKCYSKAEVLDSLKKMNKSTDDSNIDLSVDPNSPHTNECSESLPEGRPTKLTPRSSGRKSHSRDLSEDALAEDALAGGGGGSSSEPLSSQRKNVDSWLPEGWTVEVKIRKGGSTSGMRYKCYMDPISGQKFFSKPQVLNHLAKTNRSVGGQKKVFAEPISATPISAWQEKSTTEPDNSQTYEATEIKKSRTGKKTESARFSSDYEVISRTHVEGLPAGWIKEVRVRKHGPASKKDPYYLDPLSEYAFFSKKDALRYLESGDIRKCVMRPIRRDVNRDDTRNVNLTSSKEELSSPDPSKGAETPKESPNGFVEELKTNESGVLNPKPIRSITGGVFNKQDEENATDWLPDGWVVEMHYRNSGMKCKIFKETASGKKFYSKPQVLNYLADGNSSYSRKRKLDLSSSPTPADVTHPKRSRKKNSDCQEVITTSPADGLPPGWIKEIRTKIYATHKRSDPFYTDPVTGYIFRSKMDAKRYLDTGDVNLCAMRPKVKDKDGKEVFVYTHDAQKPVKPTKGKQLFEDKEDGLSTENHEESQITDPEAADNTKHKASIKIIKRSDPQASQPARSSKRQKGMDPGTDPTSEGTGGVQVKQASWVNLEKQPADDGNLPYDIPEDDNWTDQCIDFAVKTLADEILFNGQPMSGGFQEEKNETPTKVK
ncbi:hypothetical protein L1987_02940 [Smallanthus sonchifolius]|uniref:Uncharacterized protein n=1 Tax=Smallanthus sonchifolius TaxID=185202 RepID=A0ACB9K9F6_9ASTR|nr:hypothetical protein L1987_02940 [Smallanthus sonchifolius]